MMLDIDAGNPEWIHWSLTLGIAKRKRVSARMPVLCRVEKPDSMKFLSGREGEFLFTLSQRSWKISIDSPAFPRTNATRMFIFGLVSSVRSAGFLCCKIRHLLTEQGMSVAPIEVARYYAHERMLPETEGITPFAFHKWEGTNAGYPNFLRRKGERT